jgi:hypothetical protein
MVRCDEFYKKWQKAGNFCAKHPDTAERIDAYLDLLPYFKEMTANSEILSDPSEPMGAIITERASRPLISLKDSEIRQKAIQQIVQIAEQKKIDGQKPIVTTKEVEQIISKLVPQPQKATKAPKASKLDTAKNNLEAALGNVGSTPAAIDEALSTIEELSSFLQATKQKLTQRKEVLTLVSPAAISKGEPDNEIQPISLVLQSPNTKVKEAI